METPIKKILNAAKEIALYDEGPIESSIIAKVIGIEKARHLKTLCRELWLLYPKYVNNLVDSMMDELNNKNS